MKGPTIAVDARYGLRRQRRGIGEYVYQVLSGLGPKPRPYQLLLFGDQSLDPAVARQLGRWYPVVRLTAPNFFVWEQMVFPQAALRHGAQFLHGTANIGPLLSPAPLILTIHDVIEWHRGRSFPAELPLRHRLSRLYRMNALRALAPRARLIFTVSQHSARDIQETFHLDGGTIRVTPLAAKGPVGDVMGQPAPGPYLLMLGALDARKNLRGVLTALGLCQQRDIRLEVVGLEERALGLAQAWANALGVSHRVRFRPMVDDGQLEALYRGARAFLYPSFDEGFGLPVLEAMQYGCPVVASARGALPEVAGEAALYVEPADPAQIAAAMDRLWQDPALRADLAQRGRLRAAEFSWERTAELTHQGYLELCGGRT